MHRVALNHGRVLTVAGKTNAARGWSVLSRHGTRRALSDTGDSGGGSDTGDSGGGSGESSGQKGGARGRQKQVGGAGGAKQPAGRGRGAFSQFLRTHERKIGKQLRKIDEIPEDDRGGDPASGQFEDSDEGSGTKKFAGTARDEELLFEEKEPEDDSRSSKSQDDKWQEQWFSHEDKRLDKLGLEQPEGEMGGDLPELDDCEEDDHFDADDEWDDEAWKGYTPEQIEEFKILGARLEEEESKQMADLRRRWKETKADSVKKHGTAEHLELPDIVIKHEITYEAPPGKANADRSMPTPRPVETIVDSMQLPPGLDVTPDDPEYEEVVKMWMTLSRNNTMDERMKKSIIGQISTFIAKHRNSDAFQKALETQDFPEVRGRRPR
ncbi:unnamed protein product [Ectocarpus sp. CCAP 1310/34]|nr:unnamed protein product [Ectocarpus sp. CCAP 1310/34]